MGKVYLMGVTREAEGKYKCEVSTEGPTFDTDFKEENMTVYGKAFTISAFKRYRNIVFNLN